MSWTASANASGASCWRLAQSARVASLSDGRRDPWRQGPSASGTQREPALQLRVDVAIRDQVPEVPIADGAIAERAIEVDVTRNLARLPRRRAVRRPWRTPPRLGRSRGCRSRTRARRDSARAATPTGRARAPCPTHRLAVCSRDRGFRKSVMRATLACDPRGRPSRARIGSHLSQTRSDATLGKASGRRWPRSRRGADWPAPSSRCRSSATAPAAGSAKSPARTRTRSSRLTLRAFPDPEVVTGGVRVLDDEPADAQTRLSV